MTNKRLNDEQLSNQVGTIVDNVVKTIKTGSKEFFNLMVERTTESANDLFDKGVDSIKQKILKRGNDNKDEK